MISLGIIFCGVTLASLLYPFVQYFKDDKSLRRFPAPPVAAFTPLWQMYHNWRGQKFLAVDRAHRELGEVVRLGPNHVSFSNPQAWKDIYGHGSTIIKDTFYDNQAGGNPSMADTTSRELHSQKRKNMSFVFSAKQITSMEPRVMEVVTKLIRDLKIKSEGGKIAVTDRFDTSNGAFDLRPWLNMFSYDAISNMFFSKSFGFLDRGDDDCTAKSDDGSVRPVHAMNTFHTGAAFSVLLGHMSPFFYHLFKNRLLKWTFQNTCSHNFTGMARSLVMARLESPPSVPDLFSNLPTEPTEKRPTPMSLDEIIAESAVMLNAGNDTTQTALTNAMFDLATHPLEQQKLRCILEQSIPKENQPIAPYAILQHIPYLRACLDESFRVCPPLGTGLPRLTVQPTLIAGHLIPAGVTVSAQTYTLHHNSSLFPDADRWTPERWLPDNLDFTDDDRQNLKDYVFPFSLGSRACIGRNLAYMELSICLAALILAFNWELDEDAGSYKHFERFNCNPVELIVKAIPRPEVWDKLDS